MKAMIFAAGLGKRLGKITEHIPKALVDINGKTALQMAVEKCSAHGFNDIIINVHHFADMVEEDVKRLRKMGFKISVSNEREMLLETGGGLYKVREFFDKMWFDVLFQMVRNFIVIRLVFSRHDYLFKLISIGRNKFLLQSPYGKDASCQSKLARHSDHFLYRNSGSY